MSIAKLVIELVEKINEERAYNASIDTHPDSVIYENLRKQWGALDSKIYVIEKTIRDNTKSFTDEINDSIRNGRIAEYEAKAEEYDNVWNKKVEEFGLIDLLQQREEVSKAMEEAEKRIPKPSAILWDLESKLYDLTQDHPPAQKLLRYLSFTL